MVEKLKEVRELIKAKKNEEAIEKINELIASTPQPTGTEQGNGEVPLPGEGENY